MSRIKKFILVAGTLWLSFSFLFSQSAYSVKDTLINGNSVQMKINNKTGAAYQIYGLRNFADKNVKITRQNIESLSAKFLQNNKKLLKVVPQDLQLNKSEKRKDKWHLSYRQYYKNVPIYHSYLEYTVHENGNILSLGSDIHANISMDINPSLFDFYNKKEDFRAIKYPFDAPGGVCSMGINPYGKSMYNLSPLNMSSYFENNQDTVKQKKYKLKDEFFYYGKQFVIGELCGVGCAYLSLFVSMPFAPKGMGLGVIGYGATAMYIGYTIGNSLGVYWTGNTRYKSSFYKTLIGSVVGASIGVYIMSLSDPYAPPYSYAAFFGPIVGSMISYNLFRSEKEVNTFHSNDQKNEYYYFLNQKNIKYQLNKTVQLSIFQLCF